MDIEKDPQRLDRSTVLLATLLVSILVSTCGALNLSESWLNREICSQLPFLLFILYKLSSSPTGKQIKPLCQLQQQFTWKSNEAISGKY